MATICHGLVRVRVLSRTTIVVNLGQRDLTVMLEQREGELMSDLPDPRAARGGVILPCREVKSFPVPVGVHCFQAS